MLLMFGLLCMNEAPKSWDVPGKGPGITSRDENLTKLVLLLEVQLPRGRVSIWMESRYIVYRWRQTGHSRKGLRTKEASTGSESLSRIHNLY